MNSKEDILMLISNFQHKLQISELREPVVGLQSY